MSLWQDANCGYVHVFVTTEFPGRTKAVAIEPMTGPANAFNSGDGPPLAGAGGAVRHDLGHQRVPGAVSGGRASLRPGFPSGRRW